MISDCVFIVIKQSVSDKYLTNGRFGHNNLKEIAMSKRGPPAFDTRISIRIALVGEISYLHSALSQ
jgi:hypothetical protein